MTKRLDDALKTIEEEWGVKLRRRKLAELKQDPKNMRKHSDRNKTVITESMREVKAGRSVVTDGTDTIRAGNATVSVAPGAGIDEGIEIETSGKQLLIHKRSDLDERGATRLALADNQATDLSGWDADTIAAAVKQDSSLMGGIFSESDDILHAVRRALAVQTAARDEEFVIAPPKTPLTQRGDLWILGDHRIFCGDGTLDADVDRLLDGKRMQFVYTDPPYGIGIVNKDGKVGAGGPFRGKKGDYGNVIETNTYAPIIGDETTETAIKAYRLCAARKFKTMVFWGANHYASALPDSKCWIVWDKVNGDNNFADAELAWTNLDRAVRICRHQWNGLLKASERGEKRVHPTQKPVALAVWCFEKFGEGGDNVLDLFGGSGSTLIACEGSQRKAFVMELAAAYCDVMVSRWEHVTGRRATRVPAA